MTAPVARLRGEVLRLANKIGALESIELLTAYAERVDTGEFIGPVTIARVQERVARFYGLPVAEMKSSRRSAAVARPRQVAMYLSRNLTPRSLPEIGRRFGWRDHTTVIHAIKATDRRRLLDADLDNDIKLLERELRA